MAWTILFLAGLFEVGWALALKASHGFTRPVPTVLFAISSLLSMVLLGVSLRSLPLGTAYAVWTGIGAIGTAIVGITLYGESAAIPRLISIALIVLGIVGLKLFSPDNPQPVAAQPTSSQAND